MDLCCWRQPERVSAQSRLGAGQAADSKLRARFPKAELVEDDAGLASLARQVTEFIEDPSKGLDMGLDIAGTEFQKRVWNALRAIAPGSTATYEEIAERAGSPRATRAVGTACAVNKVALAIPCHRVVRKDKSLGGYRWGIEIKRKLLEREGGRRA